MATIIEFSIPQCVDSIMADYVNQTVVNQVQADLNAGSRKSIKTKTDCEAVIIKNDDGSKKSGIQFKTKSGEKLVTFDTLPCKFAAWCMVLNQASSFGEVKVSLPDDFKAWLDKFARVDKLDLNNAADKAKHDAEMKRREARDKK